MRVTILSQTGDALGVASRLRLEGHSVRMWIKSPHYKRAGQNIVERIDSWREGLRNTDLILVDMVGMGQQLEPVIRAVGVPAIGASKEMDRIELDRAHGMEVFQKYGIATPETWSFGSPDEVRSFFVGEEWGDGFAIKADGNIGCASSRVLKEPEQLEWALTQYPASCAIIVQRVVKGIEVSTEGWFNGREWIKPFNHTFEEKRFMEGNLGPNTGCMGNVVITRDYDRLVDSTVVKLKPLLTRLGWRGPVDVNCIVNANGAFALEATARFGYDAIEALLEGMRLGAGEFLREVAEGRLTSVEMWPGPTIAVRMGVPPYPSEDEAIKAEWGEPILGINENNIGHLWLCNVFVDPKDMLFKTSGGDGLTLKATARGEDVGVARRRVYRTIDNLRVTDKMYRRDIGLRAEADIKQLEQWGWL